ncbi:MAG: diacylglycerol kinase family protein [Brumimicrobium sp.]|nr:diacylglycerol kinase family protein [Brumimicrobium sp.]
MNNNRANINSVLFIVNPISGNKPKESLMEFVSDVLEKKGIEFRIYSTTGEEDSEEICELIKAKPVDRLLVAGGDGTINLVARIALEKQIPVGIFPQGSANGLAENLNLPNTDEGLLEVALGSNFLEMDVIKINDKVCTHIADFGVNAELVQNFEDSSIRGKLGYILQSVPTLIKSEYPFQFKFKIGDEEVEKEGSVLAIANCKRYGTGATINFDGKMDDGRFEVIILKHLNIIDLLKTIISEGQLEKDFAETFEAQGVSIRCSEPTPFQIDGEYIGDLEEVEASLFENKLMVAVSEGDH